MANQEWVSLINAASSRATGPGTSLVSAVGPATISPCQAGALTSDVATVNPDGQPLGWYPGLLLRVTARGFFTAGGTTSNVSLALTANKGNAGSTYGTLATTTTLTLGTTITGVQWKLEALIRCTAVSQSAGACSTQGELTLTAAVPSTPTTLAANGLTLPMPNASGETSLATIDTTQVTGIGLRATLSAAFGTAACTQWLVEALD